LVQLPSDILRLTAKLAKSGLLAARLSLVCKKWLLVFPPGDKIWQELFELQGSSIASLPHRLADDGSTTFDYRLACSQLNQAELNMKRVRCASSSLESFTDSPSGQGFCSVRVLDKLPYSYSIGYRHYYSTYQITASGARILVLLSADESHGSYGNSQTLWTKVFSTSPENEEECLIVDNTSALINENFIARGLSASYERLPCTTLPLCSHCLVLFGSIIRTEQSKATFGLLPKQSEHRGQRGKFEGAFWSLPAVDKAIALPTAQVQNAYQVQLTQLVVDSSARNTQRFLLAVKSGWDFNEPRLVFVINFATGIAELEFEQPRAHQLKFFSDDKIIFQDQASSVLYLRTNRNST